MSESTEAEKAVYLEFSGWLKVDPDTRLQYTGENEDFRPIITVRDWLTLSKNLQKDYILEDFQKTVEIGEDLDFNQLDLVIEED